MKKLTYILLVIVSISTFNCTTDAAYEDASEFNTSTFAARFTNESAANVDLVVYNVNGGVVTTTKDIAPGASFDFSDVNNETTFRIVTDSSDRIAVIDIEKTNKYYVVLNDENFVSTIQTARL